MCVCVAHCTKLVSGVVLLTSEISSIENVSLLSVYIFPLLRAGTKRSRDCSRACGITARFVSDLLLHLEPEGGGGTYILRSRSKSGPRYPGHRRCPDRLRKPATCSQHSMTPSQKTERIVTTSTSVRIRNSPCVRPMGIERVTSPI